MPSLLSRRHAIIAAVGLTFAAAVVGGAVAVHSQSGSSATAAPSASPTPVAQAPAPAAGAKRQAGAAARRSAVGRVISVTATSLTVADPSGRQTTYVLTNRTRAVGPGGRVETATGLPAGEIVIVISGGAAHPARRAPAMATPTAAPATSPSPSAAPSEPVAMSVQDTGFASR